MNPADRYKVDPVFYQVVNVLENLINEVKLTPFEIREAAMLACIRYEQRNSMAIFLSQIQPK